MTATCPAEKAVAGCAAGVAADAVPGGFGVGDHAFIGSWRIVYDGIAEIIRRNGNVSAHQMNLGSWFQDNIFAQQLRFLHDTVFGRLAIGRIFLPVAPS